MKFSLLEHKNAYYPAAPDENPGRWYAGDLYRDRHRALAEESPHKAWGHRAIAFIDAMPVIGRIAMWVEEIVVKHFANYFQTWRMRNNLQEAIHQHAAPEVIRPEELTSFKKKPIRYHVFETQRKPKEDRYIILYNAIGVFDGHGGAAVADHLKQHKWSSFIDLPRVRFRRLFNAIQSEIASLTDSKRENRDLKDQGSTATVVTIDREEAKAVAATIGDSWAFVYREIKGAYKAIPLSPIRNWAHPKELARAKKITPTFTPAENDPSPRYFGTRVSRSIGDVMATDDNGKRFLSATPKVTEITLKSQDVLVIASDGLWDESPHKIIIESIHEYRAGTTLNIAHKILSKIPEKRNKDEITLVALDII